MGLNRHVKPWLAMALMACLAQNNEDVENLAIDWTGVTAEREVAASSETGTTKYLDIIIGDGSFVIGVENKVYASSHYNPFSDYDSLLEKRANGGPILKCILQASPRTANIKRPWPIVTYAELVEKALEMYGQHVALSPPSKWHFFYQELLLHLRQLSNPARKTSMTTESTEFVIDHFAALQKAKRLLDAFDSDLSVDGAKAVSTALSDDKEASVNTGTASWQGGRTKALRFFPAHWGGQSQVVIYYYGNPEKVDGGGSIVFCVRAFIDRKHAKNNLEDIEDKFKLSAEKNILPNEIRVDMTEDFIWYESSRRLLCLDCYSAQNSRSGALMAAASLAKWIQANAFDQKSS